MEPNSEDFTSHHVHSDGSLKQQYLREKMLLFWNAIKMQSCVKSTMLLDNIIMIYCNYIMYH